MSATIRYPITGIPKYPNLASLPAASQNGDLAVTLDTDILYISDGTTWTAIGGSTTVLSVGTIDGQAASSDGASIVGNALFMQSASGTKPGLINTTTQNLAGDKTLSGNFAATNFTGSSSGTNTGDVTLGAVGASPSANAASLSGQVLTLQPADATHPGVMDIGMQAFSGDKTFTGAVVIGDTLTVDAMSTFLENISITNALVSGTPGTASQITTGDPNTVGLIIRGSSFNSGGFGPANPTAQNITGGMTYSAGLFTGSASITAWDEGFRSVQSFAGNGYTEFEAGNSAVAFICGLSTSFSGTPPIYTFVDFGFYGAGNGSGNLRVIENGSSVFGPVPYAPGDVLRVERSGTSILYIQNGVVLYTHSAVSAATMLFGAYTIDGNEPGPWVISDIIVFYGSLIDQTSDLQQWESDAGTVTAKVSADGAVLGATIGTLVAGGGLSIKEGSDARSGTAVLVGGTVTVSNTSVTSNTRIYVCSQIDGGTPGWLRISAIVAATSFDITSSSILDTSTVAWLLVEGT